MVLPRQSQLEASHMFLFLSLFFFFFFFCFVLAKPSTDPRVTDFLSSDNVGVKPNILWNLYC